MRLGLRSQDAVEMLRLCITIGLLVAFVLTAHDLLGLAVGVSILVGGPATYLVSVRGLRWLLPDRVPASDAERVSHTPRITVLVLAGTLCTLLVHFAARISWYLSASMMVGLVVCVIIAELWLRRRATRRMN